jgi:hypothetical protein
MQAPGSSVSFAALKEATNEGAEGDATRDHLLSGGQVCGSIHMTVKNASVKACSNFTPSAKGQAEVACAASTKEEKNTTANAERERLFEELKTKVMRESEMKEGEQIVKRNYLSCPGPAKVGLNHEGAAPPRLMLADVSKMRLAMLLGRVKTGNGAIERAESHSALPRATNKMQGRRITESAEQEENDKVCVNEASVSGDGRDSTSRAGYGSKELDEVFRTPRPPSQCQHALPVMVNRIDSENLKNKGFMVMGKGEVSKLNANKDTVSVQQAELQDVIGVEGIDTQEESVTHALATEGTCNPPRDYADIERTAYVVSIDNPALEAAWHFISSSDEDEQSVGTQDPTRTVKEEGSRSRSRSR